MIPISSPICCIILLKLIDIQERKGCTLKTLEIIGGNESNDGPLGVGEELGYPNVICLKNFYNNIMVRESKSMEQGFLMDDNTTRVGGSPEYA